MAFVVFEGIDGAGKSTLIKALEKELAAEAVDFVTTFRNKQVGEGRKSLTLTLDFRDPARTLKSEEVDAQMKSAVELLGQRFGAVLRA